MLAHALRLIGTLGLHADTVTVDACLVVPMQQLRFVVAAGLGRTFPVRESREGNSVSLADLKVGDLTCPDLRVELTLTLREDPPRGAAPVSRPGTARVLLALSSTASFAAGLGKPAHTAAALSDATLCVHRVGPVDLKVERSPPWLTPAWLATRLASELIGRGCIDITSLVYVFLQRGGTLNGPSPPP